MECRGAAHDAAELGLPVFPVGKDKRPLVKWSEFRRRSPTEDEVEQWFTRWPDANLGLATGEMSGVDVLDFDPGSEGWPPPETPLPVDVVVRTPRGGQHYYIAHLPGLHNSASMLAHHVDVRAEGGYVVIPPSSTEDGSYCYEFGGLPQIAALGRTADWPEWLVAALDATMGRARGPRAPAEGEGVETIPSGRRNEGLMRVGVKLRKDGLSILEVEESLLVANQVRCRPPLPEAEVRAIARSVSRYAPARSATVVNPLAYPFTDAGNGELLRDLYGEKLRFNHTSGRWMIWAGNYWVEDRTASALRGAKAAARARAAAAEELTGAQADEAMKWARRSEAAERLRAALALASSERVVATSVDDWDTDPLLLACRNGTLDLRAGEFRKGHAGDLVSHCTAVAYAPDAPAPRWEKFVRQTFEGDDELIAFVQRAVGYTLTGDTGEQVWLLCHGRGGNGKTVLLQTLRRVLGTYARTLPFTCLEAGRGGDIPNDLAMLPGVRFALSSETNPAARLDAAKLKSITGGDSIVARFLRQEFFEFIPSFKLWVAVNHLPYVGDATEGFWRRCLVVPFEHTVAPADRIRGLDRILPAEEAPGILNWALAGYRQWAAQGLAPPEAVRARTEVYRADADPLADFVGEALEAKEGAQRASNDLYQVYLHWSQERQPGAKPLSRTTFGRRMGERFTQTRDKNQRKFEGVAIRADWEPEYPASWDVG